MQGAGVEAADELHRIEECLAQAKTHLRCITRGLAAVDVPGHDLPEALRQLCAEMSRLFGLTCRFHAEVTDLRLAGDAATHLYCIAREALCNAIRHGKASTVSVALCATQPHRMLSICDNGQGFAATTTAQSGVGLKIMSYRARLLGGSLHIEKSGGGMLVKCMFPTDT